MDERSSGRSAEPVSELEAKGWTREQIDEVRLAYVAEAPVNWCPSLGTVLANEEVPEWEEKGHVVERRPLAQWMLRITKYAQRLIDELDDLDWPEGIKLLQRNWIGRSEGARVKFSLAPSAGSAIIVPEHAPSLARMGVWMMQGEKDPISTSTLAQQMVAAIQDALFAAGLTALRLGLEHTDDPKPFGVQPQTKADQVLQPNMVVNVDMPHTEIGWGSVHMEDTVVITGDGFKRLASADFTLRVINR